MQARGGLRPRPGRAQAAAAEFGADAAVSRLPRAARRDDIDIIDVVTRDAEHFEINCAAIEAGKHVLSEKPVAHDYRDVRRVADLAVASGLKTKVGFTFRYSPAVRYLKDMLDRGSLGTPFIYNAYEQNSQWLDPMSPAAQRRADAARARSRSPRWRATARR